MKMTFPTTTLSVWRHYVIFHGETAMHFKRFRNRSDSTEAMRAALDNREFLYNAMRAARMTEAEIDTLTEGKDLRDNDPAWNRPATPYDATACFRMMDMHENMTKEEYLERKQDREVAKVRRQLEFGAMQRQAVIDGAR